MERRSEGANGLPPTALTPARGVAPLQRAFRALVFDWDGTAVVDRAEDATPLARVLERLLRRQVWIVVVTGTNFGNVERQCCRLVRPSLRHHLLICTNRGSEVYGFTPAGEPVRRWLRAATPGEERALTASAEAVRDTIVARTGLDVRIVYDRLNRRKIDLIPLPEWTDPPKAQIGALLAAVEARLRGAGLAGGLGETVRLTERLAAAHGLPDARITSDVKHIEVGLTDKGDSLAWLREHLLAPEGIAPREVLIAGDEFGPVAGFPGSDDRLRAGIRDAVVVSVGAEPNGVPAAVLHLGGGPRRFRALLADQVRFHRNAGAAGPARRQRRGVTGVTADWAREALKPPADPAWRLLEPRRQPALEHEIESRVAIGNGLLGVRGSREQPIATSRPRTFVAGLFDGSPDEVAGPTLLSGPDWLRLRLELAGQPLSFDSGHTLAYVRTLDWRRGVLLSDWYQRDAAGHTVRLHALRFASLAHRALAGQIAQLEVEQALPASLGAWLEPSGSDLSLLRAEGELTVWRAPHSARRLAVATTTALQLDSVTLPPEPGGGPTQPCWVWPAGSDRAATFSRLVAIARGSDQADPGDAARAVLRQARRTGLPRLLAAHQRAWAERWTASDIVVAGDAAAERALRFAAYHLISAADPDDEHVSVGARALTGDAYRGHVFWDTEIFSLPFYTFTWPAAARAMLMYRYHTLPAARAKAARLGYRGALYAWESADTGDEATPARVRGPNGREIIIRCGTEEQHISADIAYAVWQYWQATADDAFLLAAGAEILLETARFWASRAVPEAEGRYHIRGVIGPDEYHEGVDDNAYTNQLARWNLERGLGVTRLLATRWPERWAALRERLGLTEEEPAHWHEVAERLETGLDPQSGLIEQFAGFFGLEPVDLAAYAARSAPMDVVLGPEQTRRSQVIKQADVVMLLALLEEHFPAGVRAANFHYYEPRCGHGSSLSPAVHALVAARLDELETAERYFHQAATIDLDDTMGNAALGVHIGALGGLWQAAVLGYGGLGLAPDGLRVDPHLPAGWQELEFAAQWHGRRVRITVRSDPRTVSAVLERGRPMRLYVGGRGYRLRRGEPQSVGWGAVGASGQEIPA